MASSEPETHALTIGSSPESSRTVSDPLLEDMSTSSPRVAKLGIKDGVTTSEDPLFMAYERAAKGLLAKITGGRLVGEVLSV